MASSRPARSARFYLFSIASLAVAGGAVLYFHYARNQEIAGVREARAAGADRGPRVEVVTAPGRPTARMVQRPGQGRSGASTTLYSKVAGYLKTISVDKGDKVEAGQVIAEIDSPELNQQYAAAAADLANKQRNLSRIKGLYERGNATQVAMYQAETDATM